MIEIPTTPGTSTVAKPDSEAEPPPDPPTAWPIFGNTKRKTKHKRNGCTRVRITNSPRFSQDHQVADMSARIEMRLVVSSTASAWSRSWCPRGPWFGGDHQSRVPFRST